MEDAPPPLGHPHTLARPANARRAFSWPRVALIRPLGSGHNMTPWGCRGAGREPGCKRAAPRFLLLRWFQVWPRLGCRGKTGATSTRLGGTPVKRANP